MSTPILTREQVRRVDSIAIGELRIPGVVLMENAGRNATDHIADLLAGRDANRVVVLCGPGNNGGDGFVIARHLLNRGIDTTAYLVGTADRLTPDAATNHAILVAMGQRIEPVQSENQIARLVASLRATDMVVDALLGTGFQGDVREPLATLIRGINDADTAAVVAVDVPSGLDCDTGQPCRATVRADRTVTFVANKIGFTRPGADAFTGDVFVADIGAPPSLLERL